MATIRALARLVGLISLTAVVLGVPPPRASAQAPDPTLLPVATTTQVPLSAAYNNLRVSTIPAGGFYLDPTTAVRVYRLTSSTFPTSSANWGHDYAEFGNEVSLPWRADGTRTIKTNAWSGAANWLLDFTPGVGVSNPRPLTGTLSPARDNAFTFSNNPATPYYAYVGNGSSIIRFDLRTMTAAPGDGWPVNGTDCHELSQAINDAFFTWLNGPSHSGSPLVAYTPSTGRLVTRTDATSGGVYIDRAGRYAGISVGSGDAIDLWDTVTDTILWHYDPRSTSPQGPPIAHGASLQGMYFSNNYFAAFPDYFGTVVFGPSGPNPVNRWGPSVGVQSYCSGTWVQPVNQLDAWVVCSNYGELVPTPTSAGWLSPGGLAVVTANGARRLVGHHYSYQTTYTWYSWAKFSPDGAYVLFTSDMNGSGRNDLFLAQLPLPVTSGNSIIVTTPTPGATVRGSIAVSATAQASAGVAGVQFKLDNSNLGKEVLTSPYSITWNTRTAADGAHALKAVLRDKTGQLTESAAVSVTVANHR